MIHSIKEYFKITYKIQLKDINNLKWHELPTKLEHGWGTWHKWNGELYVPHRLVDCYKKSYNKNSKNIFFNQILPLKCVTNQRQILTTTTTTPAIAVVNILLAINSENFKHLTVRGTQILINVYV